MSGSGMQPALTQADYETLASLRFALRRFASFSAAAAREAGLTTHQHQALLAIKGCPTQTRMTVGHLAEQLLVAPHTAAELAVRLEGAGLIRKVTDADDRRRVVLELTPRAEACLRRLTLAHLREVRELAPRLLTLFTDLDALSRVGTSELSEERSGGTSGDKRTRDSARAGG